MIDIIKREFPQVIGLGVVMVQAGDGKWYVSPLRTTSDVMVSLLKGLEPTDIDYFISLAQGKSSLRPAGLVEGRRRGAVVAAGSGALWGAPAAAPVVATSCLGVGCARGARGPVCLA